MKIGPVVIKFADKKRPPMDEIGASGTVVWGGQLSETEYNKDLRGEKAIKVYDKMRRSDGRVKATLLACTLPIRSATWDIKSASEDKQDIDIAEELKANLFEGMTITWDSFLSHVLLMLPFGFSIFEKVWEVRDGTINLRKLAPRLPQTLFQWLPAEGGGIAGIKQYVFKNDSFSFIDIPIEKLLIFTNEKEGDNFEGLSILRSSYKHWFYKDNLYRIDAIAAERHATGVPTFKTPSTATKEEKDKVDEVGQRLYAQEQQFIRMGEGWEFDIKGLSGTVRDIKPSIDMHNKAISESILADFLDLGAGDRGSWALSKDKSSFFLMALESVTMNITDTINRYAIPQWVDYNYPDVEAYPKLTCSGLERREVLSYAQAVTALLGVGGLTPDAEMEAELRVLLRLPPKPEPKKQKEVFLGAEAKTKRGLTSVERFVAFAEIEKKLDASEEAFIKATKEVMTRQIDNLVEEAVKIIDKKALDKIDGIEVRYKTQMAERIYTVLKDLLDYGREQVRKELKQQKKLLALAEPLPISPDDLAIIEELLKARAKASAGAMASKLRNFTTFEALRQIKTGLDKETLVKNLKDLSDRELVATAKYSTSEAFNYGRSVEAERLKDEIDRVQYSAILDNNVCLRCEPLDGEEWEFDDPQTAKYAGGNPECLGAGRCRCLLVFISKAETKAIK